MDAEIFFNKRWIEHNKKESDPDMHLSLSAEELELIETTIVDFSNLRIIEVLEEIYQESQFIKMWAAIGNKIKELKLRAVEDEKDDIKDLNTVGGGYGFKDILGC